MTRTLAEQLDEFEKHALLRAEAMDAMDSRKANRHYDRAEVALGGLRTCGTAGLAALTPLLEHDNPRVACTVSCELLPFEPVRARAVLEALDSGGGDVGFAAAQILKLWDAGSLVRPWDDWGVEPSARSGRA